MTMKAESIVCPTCDEVIDFCNGESTVFCPICEDTVFTDHYTPTLGQQIDDDYYGRAVYHG